MRPRAAAHLAALLLAALCASALRASSAPPPPSAKVRFVDDADASQSPLAAAAAPLPSAPSLLPRSQPPLLPASEERGGVGAEASAALHPASTSPPLVVPVAPRAARLAPPPVRLSFTAAFRGLSEADLRVAGNADAFLTALVAAVGAAAGITTGAATAATAYGGGSVTVADVANVGADGAGWGALHVRLALTFPPGGAAARPGAFVDALNAGAADGTRLLGSSFAPYGPATLCCVTLGEPPALTLRGSGAGGAGSAGQQAAPAAPLALKLARPPPAVPFDTARLAELARFAPVAPPPPPVLVVVTQPLQAQPAPAAASVAAAPAAASKAAPAADPPATPTPTNAPPAMQPPSGGSGGAAASGAGAPPAGRSPTAPQITPPVAPAGAAPGAFPGAPGASIPGAPGAATGAAALTAGAGGAAAVAGAAPGAAPATTPTPVPVPVPTPVPVPVPATAAPAAAAAPVAAPAAATTTATVQAPPAAVIIDRPPLTALPAPAAVNPPLGGYGPQQQTQQVPLGGYGAGGGFGAAGAGGAAGGGGGAQQFPSSGGVPPAKPSGPTSAQLQQQQQQSQQQSLLSQQQQQLGAGGAGSAGFGGGGGGGAAAGGVDISQCSLQTIQSNFQKARTRAHTAQGAHTRTLLLCWHHSSDALASSLCPSADHSLPPCPSCQLIMGLAPCLSDASDACCASINKLVGPAGTYANCAHTQRTQSSLLRLHAFFLPHTLRRASRAAPAPVAGLCEPSVFKAITTLDVSAILPGVKVDIMARLGECRTKGAAPPYIGGAGCTAAG
jgi:hypothetical protein